MGSVKDELNKRLENSEVLAHTEVRPGVHELDIRVGENGRPANDLAYLTGQDGEPSPVKFRTAGSTITRDYVRRVDLDLLTDAGDPAKLAPDKIYNKALIYYKTKGFYGTIIDTLTNFAAKGFKNDIDDPEIKLFYDTWGREVDFQSVVEKILFDFFRVGLVRTLKVVGKFEPKLKPEDFDQVVSKKTRASAFATSPNLKELMAYTELSAAKKVWSKAFIPIDYTILDPRLIDIKGPLLFDQTDTYLKPEAFKELRELLKVSASKLTKEQKEFIRTLPKELVTSIKSGKPVQLPPELVGKCDYRRQDYERYPMPRILRAFDAMDYKDALVKADFSTLDGITNYILKITIGSDEHPVTNQSELETIARLFDTSSKGFDIVWNHTLNIEKITFPEIATILGQEKFQQVNDDISQTLGVTRALLDGNSTGNAKAIDIATKSFIEEINYARRCVTRWINNEYEEVALAVGFDRYPRVRFDDLALKDEIMLMSVLQGMIDRRILSYETGIEKLGFDFGNELTNMINEKPMVQDGTLGIIGSPYNAKALPPSETPSNKDITDDPARVTLTKEDLVDFQRNVELMIQTGLKNVQPTQRTPKGTPSEGRPRTGGKGKPRQKSTKPNTKPTLPNTGIKNTT